MFLLIAFAHASLVGIIFSMCIDFGWGIEVLAVSMHFVTAVLLMRAPYSVKNIDSFPVTILRLILLLYFGFVEAEITSFGARFGFDLTTTSMVIMLFVTMYLLFGMKIFRKAR